MALPAGCLPRFVVRADDDPGMNWWQGWLHKPDLEDYHTSRDKGQSSALSRLAYEAQLAPGKLI